jgi:hypothetical protein
MAPPIWFDPIFVAQLPARIESRLVKVEPAVDRHMALLRNPHETPSSGQNKQGTALLRLFACDTIPLTLICAPEFLQCACELCPGFPVP